jgi:hypothetical protein
MKRSGSASDPLWYKDAIIYELPVKAFYDSNQDGIGDFGGLLQKLDYLQDLGVTCLWLLPFFPSPLRDDGYDISDYCNVHPSYGSLDDFRAFLNAAHDRDMQVMIELVVNHTSDQHPWFQAARQALTAAHGAGEEKVSAPRGVVADSSFGPAVVDLERAVAETAAEEGPLVDGVGRGPAQRGLGQEFGMRAVDPSVQLVQGGQGARAANFAPRLRIDTNSLALGLDEIDVGTVAPPTLRLRRFLPVFGATTSPSEFSSSVGVAGTGTSGPSAGVGAPASPPSAR